jgi:hypothetical protein
MLHLKEIIQQLMLRRVIRTGVVYAAVTALPVVLALSWFLEAP